MTDTKGKLADTIDLDGGFLDYLYGKNVLSREHAEEIEKTPHNKTEKLLDFLVYRYNGDYS